MNETYLGGLYKWAVLLLLALAPVILDS
jgi:hypothetical protein